MFFLPVAERELRVKARQPKTYRERMRSAILAVLIMLGMIWFRGVSLPPAILGRMIFDVAALFTALYCLFESVRHTADCLSEETREGTLGLLFLARLEAHEVVLGKLISATLASFYSLLAIFPVMGVPIFMGGVTGGEVFRLLLALINTQFYAVTASLWVSSRSSHQIKAWTGAGALVAAISFGPWILAEMFAGGGVSVFHWLSPFSACLLAMDQIYSASPEAYWSSLLIGHFIGWLLFALACFGVKTNWRESRAMKPAGFWLVRWWQEQCEAAPRKLRHRPAMRQLLETDPVAWLGVRRNVQTAYVWLAMMGGGTLLFMLSRNGGIFARSYATWICLLGCGLALKIWVALTACNALSSARRDGTLEILVSTPLTVKEIVGGYFSGLRRLFLAPVLGWCAIAACTPFFALDQVQSSFAHVAFYAYGLLVFHLLAILDLHALGWVGLWHGLSGNKTHVALGKTFFLVVVVPWLVLLIPFVGVVLMVLSPVWSVLLMYRAQDRICQRFLSVLSGAPAGNTSPPSPPNQPPDVPDYLPPPPLPMDAS